LVGLFVYLTYTFSSIVVYNKDKSKLSFPPWKRAVAGRNQYMEIRKIRRNIKKDFLSFNKECFLVE
jgi:hypothetical protein